MSYLDRTGLGALAERIAAKFPFRTEAAGSMNLSGTNIVLVAVSGNTLSTVDLNSKFATDSEAGKTLEISGNKITLKAVDGTTLSSVDIGSAISSAVSSGTSGLISESVANSRYVRSLSISGNTLSYNNYYGNRIGSVTLPS